MTEKPHNPGIVRHTIEHAGELLLKGLNIPKSVTDGNTENLSRRENIVRGLRTAIGQIIDNLLHRDPEEETHTHG